VTSHVNVGFHRTMRFLFELVMLDECSFVLVFRGFTVSSVLFLVLEVWLGEKNGTTFQSSFFYLFKSSCGSSQTSIIRAVIAFVLNLQLALTGVF
jgi:hypothetical protein